MVNGRLAMTRSIGDYDLKPFGVTAVPDTKEIEIKHGKDAFLILTTDGINYVMNDDEIIAAVNSCSTTFEASQYVTEQAMVYSSEDNASSLGKIRFQNIFIIILLILSFFSIIIFSLSIWKLGKVQFPIE